MKRKKVYVAMSGGVDSSVAAALLKKRGFDVVGVFMKPWSPDSDSFCIWKEDREDAMRAASVLGIPLLTWDFSKQYKKSVTDYMIREYKAGRTPNPDVMCNKEIKFGLFLKQALKEGADYIATGHYVRLRRKIEHSGLRITNSKIRNPQSAIFELHTAKDKNKDQSYFLWTLTQEQLKYCVFPIGDYTKPEVRKLAKRFKLPNHDKKDSQGVCFIGPLDMKEFLLKYIKPRSGKVIHKDGRVLGKHDGVYYYTIGQRHGLNLGIAGGPYYVVGKDIKKNIIYVGKDGDAVCKDAKVSNTNWCTMAPIVQGSVDVKVRYRARSVKAFLNREGILKFKKPERAVTSGQSAVFYKGQRLLGGGIIL